MSASRRRAEIAPDVLPLIGRDWPRSHHCPRVRLARQWQLDFCRLSFGRLNLYLGCISAQLHLRLHLGCISAASRRAGCSPPSGLLPASRGRAGAAAGPPPPSPFPSLPAAPCGRCLSHPLHDLVIRRAPPCPRLSTQSSLPPPSSSPLLARSPCRPSTQPGTGRRGRDLAEIEPRSSHTSLHSGSDHTARGRAPSAVMPC